MINELTKKQFERLEIYKKKWIKTGLDTTPITLEIARPIIDNFYTHILKKEKPAIIIIMDNPVHIWLSIFCFQVENQVENQVWNQVRNQVRNQVMNQVWNQVRNQVGNQVGNQVENFVWPYADGSFMASWFSFYDYIFTELIKCSCSDYDYFRETSKLSLIYPFDDVCILCDKPEKIEMRNGLLHKDGGPSITFRGGFFCWSLNGVAVPQWLSETSEYQLDPMRIREIENADVRREFVRKVGLGRLKSKICEKVLDKKTIYLDTPEQKNWPCNYELLLLDFGNNVKRTALQMDNPSLPDTIHVEYVDSQCATVEQAMNFRLRRTEKDIDDVKGTAWELHGDRICIPPSAVKIIDDNNVEYTGKVRRWPRLIA